jgi:hypothetical protein
MLFMLPNVEHDADWTPGDAEAVAEMTKDDESLTKAGVLLSVDGLHSPSEGVRISFSGGKRTVALHRGERGERGILADPGQDEGRGD